MLAAEALKASVPPCAPVLMNSGAASCTDCCGRNVVTVSTSDSIVSDADAEMETRGEKKRVASAVYPLAACELIYQNLAGCSCSAEMVQLPSFTGLPPQHLGWRRLPSRSSSGVLLRGQSLWWSRWCRLVMRRPVVGRRRNGGRHALPAVWVEVDGDTR